MQVLLEALKNEPSFRALLSDLERGRTPVVLSGASKIRVEIVPPDAAWLDEAHDGYRIGLFTVASQATAESILGNISYNKRYAKNSLALRVVQNDASSYTVEGVFTPKPGVFISVW